MPSIRAAGSTRRSRRGAAVTSGRSWLVWAAKRCAVMTVALTAAIALTTATTALAGGGTVGEPQPELALFQVGSSSGSGAGAVLPDGTLVLAAGLSNGTISVCRLHPGDRKCASTATLHAASGDTFGGGPLQVLATGGKDVSIVAEDCCYFGNKLGFSGGAAVFDSTNDGTTFGHEIYAGTISSTGAGTFADGQIVVGTYESGSLDVQAFPPNPSTAETNTAQPNTAIDGNTSLTTDDHKLLVASDDTANTRVEYASFGSDFNATGSYKLVADLPNETLNGISGNALLTDKGGSITGGSERLRFFNGSSFGAPHKVPEPKNGDDGYFTLEEVGSVVRVFFLNRRNGYDIYQETTTNGVKWSGLTVYNTAITSSDLVPVLDSIGSGLVFESGTGSYHSLAQPILLPQSVHVTLEHSTVTVGASTKLSGTVSPHLSGQTVTLERLASKKWYSVATTTESAAGKFSFTVPGKTETYRAVVAYKPGYYLYGYSNSVTLTAVPKKSPARQDRNHR